MIHADFEQVQEAMETAPQQPIEATEVVEAKVSKIKDEIERAMAKKDTGAEPLETGFITPNIPPKKENWFASKWKKALVTLGFAGAVAGAQAADKMPGKNDTLSQDTDKVRTMETPKDTVPKSAIDMKKLESLGIIGIEPVKQSDTTKEVFLIGLEKYKNFKDILDVIKKAGFSPSSVETMDKAINQNKKLFTNAGAVMSLEEIVNKLGNPSYAVTNVDRGGNIILESREIGGGNQGDGKSEILDMDSQYDRYAFIVEREVPQQTTVDYASLTK